MIKSAKITKNGVIVKVHGERLRATEDGVKVQYSVTVNGSVFCWKYAEDMQIIDEA